MSVEAETSVLTPRGPSSDVSASTSRQRRVGRYELIMPLARGGMATVYLGRALGEAGFEKAVAVKIIHPHLADEPKFVGMFLDEARIAARIHHPNVVEILDLGEDGGDHYMVMELVEGENLAALNNVHEGIFPLAVSLQVIADTLEGLAAAHRLCDPDGIPYKLVHRDVSPHNLLVTMEGWVKVADFGIMKAAGKNSTTRTGELRGKIAYMSPEQARGDALDLRADVFASGVILWEILTGQRLFARDSEAATLSAVMQCKVPTLRSLNSPHLQGLSGVLVGKLQSILDRSLASDRQERFNDAGAMLAAIKEVSRGCPMPQGGRGEDVDARRFMAELMAGHFTGHLDYVRAALRSTSRETHAHRPPPLPAPERRSATAVQDRRLSPEDARRSLQSLTSTVTTTLPGIRHPLLQWGMWLLLPALGAGMTILVMNDGDEPTALSEAGALPASPKPRVPSEVEPQLHRPPLLDEEVTWWLRTEPPGATVTIDGRMHSGSTPGEFRVATADSYEVRFERAGYRHHVVLLPARSDHKFAVFSLAALEPNILEDVKTDLVRIKHRGAVRNYVSSQRPRGIAKNSNDERLDPRGAPDKVSSPRGEEGFLPLPQALRGTKSKTGVGSRNTTGDLPHVDLVLR